MRLKILAMAGFLLLGGGVHIALQLMVLPYVAQHKLRATFEQLGFDTISIGSVEARHNQIRLRSIVLTEDKFNKIDTIILQYNTVPLLLNGVFKSILLTKPEFTFDIGSNNQIALSGVKDIGSFFQPKLVHTTQKLDIQNAIIDVFHYNQGAFRIHLDAFSNQTHHENHQIQISAKTAQKALKLETKATGIIDPNGGWDIRGEILNAGFENAFSSFNRASGKFMSAGSSLSSYINTFEFDIGGLKIFGIPLRESSATIEQTAGSYSGILAGTLLKHDKVEFSLALSSELKDTLSGTLFSSQMRSTLSAISAYLPSLEDLKCYSSLGELDDIFLKFEVPISDLNTQKKSIRFNLINTDFGIENIGELKLDAQNNISITSLFSPDIQNISMPGQTIFTHGRLDGKYNDHSKDAKQPLPYSLSAEITDGHAISGPMTFRDIRGDLPFDCANKGDNFLIKSPFTFALDIDPSISQKGSVDVLFDAGEVHAISNIHYEIFEGTLESQIIPDDLKTEHFTFSLKNLNGSAFLKALNIQDIQFTGQLNGDLSFRILDNDIEFTQTLLKSSQPGIIRIPQTMTKSLFKKASFESEATVKALEYFEYTDFSIEFEGLLFDHPDLKMKITGRNPNYLEGRDISLIIEPGKSIDLGALLQKLHSEQKL